MQPTRKLSATFFALAMSAASVPLASAAYASTCPPGYGGTYPKCVPKQAKRPRAFVAHSNARGVGATSVHATQEKHGIIFVGGKAALNPQPIPPGRSTKVPPHPGTPIEHEAAGH
jgi:hypothetical protein